jgi:hypothetical protein
VNSITLPVEARYPLSTETIRLTGKLVSDAIMPRWLQIAVPTIVGLQALAQAPKLLSGQIPILGIFIFLLILTVLIAGPWYWAHRRTLRQAEAMKGKEVVIHFFEDRFHFYVAGHENAIAYRSVTRAGRDQSGLALIAGGIGSLGIPNSAFQSVEHRDFVFEQLKVVLKKKP